MHFHVLLIEGKSVTGRMHSPSNHPLLLTCKSSLLFASGTMCTVISHNMPLALTAVDVGKICARHLVYGGLAAE